ncbi:MAG: sugar phosphate nucleotidyltransferase [candidate division WOR-3 bacterium]
MVPHIIILAAGIGKRMKSKKIKVLHELMGKPIIEWVINLAKSLSPESITLVYGKDGEVLKGIFKGINYAFQEKPTGTGAAVSIALKTFKECKGDVIVLSGDTPLLMKESLIRLLEYHKKQNNDATIMTFFPEDPKGYGRIIRKGEEIIQIIEEKDATPTQKEIREVNGGIYVFSIPKLKEALKFLTPNNAQGEYYLTDVISLIKEAGGKVGGVIIENSWELKGINTRRDLAEVTDILRRKKIEALQEEGVTIIMPDTVFIEPEVMVGKDTIIYPNVVLRGKSIIGSNCILEPFVYLVDKEIPSGTIVKSGERI